MFESAELGHCITDREYDRKEPRLREALLKAQYDLLENKSFPVIIVIGGVDGAGKGETVNILNEWMDPRHIVTHAFGEMSDEERERPRMWRYWRALPPKGRIGILFGAWHTEPIVNRVLGRTDDAQLELAMEEIVRFERMLSDEGALILKFWFHLSKKAQKKRLKALEADPKTRWRVTDTDWERFKLYDRFRKVSENALRETSTGYAPWIVVEGTDPNYRYLTVGRTLLDALTKRLAGNKPAVSRPGRAARTRPRRPQRAVQPGLRQASRAQGVQPQARKIPGRAESAHAPQKIPPEIDRHRVRRRGRRGQGRQHTPHHGRARRASLPGHSGRRTHRGRARATLSVAVLAQPAAPRAGDHLRPLLVRPRAGRARRKILLRKKTGCAPITRSTISRSRWSRPAAS